MSGKLAGLMLCLDLRHYCIVYQSRRLKALLIFRSKRCQGIFTRLGGCGFSIEAEITLKSVLSESLATASVQTVAGFWMVLVDVAESEESSISLRCIMEYHPGPEHGFWEMAFDFAIKDGNDFFYSQDREFVRKYLPDIVTGDAILDAVKQCYKMLVERANAHQIYRACGSNLPDKALKKHKELTDVLLSLGYELIDEGTNDYGSPYWLCQKLNT